jgi:hypothetical protein
MNFESLRENIKHMKEVIKEAEDKLAQEELLERQKEEERIKNEADSQNHEKTESTKKNVFAKFKKYNDSSSKGPSSQTQTQGGNAQSSNSSQQTQQQKSSNKKMILKEKANHYTCEGKIINYNILKKIDRKVVDKTYALTFAEYKRMMQESTKDNK